MSQALAVSHGEFGRAAIYDLDRPITTHAHREGHLIFYIAGNHAKTQVCNEIIPLNRATAVAVSPWEPHYFDPMSGASCLCLVLYIKPMWFLENSQSAEFALNFGRPRLALTADLAATVQRLAGLMLSDGTELCIDSLLIDLTTKCYEATWAGRERPTPVGLMGRFSDYRIRKSQRLMLECLENHVGLDSLAGEVGLSRPHFFKLFKKQTGVTPNVYFNTLRSERAIEDLTQTEKSVTEISVDLGFASQASFTRFFAMNVGIAPTDYRRTAMVS
ncbi:helix-turn-helix domain-containing protein [Roseobacter sinensis]|uniref:AraC family transcriptional regulator n=1 Tax=Roseobacter sinensis TaxID=2931391 RepID=A0ABT3BIM1_9RHOB|nr:AraC family transcriptional regulator [Roseobacter sp. WL0113]MCV3273427.1 AraC family transcriptional regulator [Roseobacter sp. WL0113]